MPARVREEQDVVFWVLFDESDQLERRRDPNPRVCLVLLHADLTILYVRQLHADYVTAMLTGVPGGNNKHAKGTPRQKELPITEPHC